MKDWLKERDFDIRQARRIVHECKVKGELLLLLRSNPSRQQSKVLYHWGVRKRGKTGKHGNVKVKRKWWVLTQPLYSLQGNRR